MTRHIITDRAYILLLFVSDGDENESIQTSQASKEETEKLIEQILLDVIYKVVAMDETSDVDGKDSIQSPPESMEPTEKLVHLISEDVVNQVAETDPDQFEGKKAPC